MQRLLVALTTSIIGILSFFGFPISSQRDKVPQEVSESVRFIVFGDSGKGDSQQKKLANIMEKYPIDLFIHTGDIAYDSGTVEEIQKNFFEVYQNLLNQAHFYPAPGNHDYATNNLKPYLEKFGVDRYYSFDKGPIHFISLDTNASLEGNSMLEWLRSDLQNVPTEKWIVAYFHHPLYSSGVQHGSSLDARNKLEPILSKYKVDLVFAGHEHNYERTQPIKGITHIVTGGGSGTLYGFGNISNQTEFYAVQTHFVYISADHCFLTGKAINIDNETIDAFTLTRCTTK